MSSVDIFWDTTTGKGRIRPMGVWLLQEPNNNLKWCPVFIDHYSLSEIDFESVVACLR